jgi:hypothetical protein
MIDGPSRRNVSWPSRWSLLTNNGVDISTSVE